jgi:hypothetical protein
MGGGLPSARFVMDALKFKPPYIRPEGVVSPSDPTSTSDSHKKRPVLALEQGTWVVGLFSMISNWPFVNGHPHPSNTLHKNELETQDTRCDAPDTETKNLPAQSESRS